MRILVALDQSPFAVTVLEKAIALAKQTLAAGKAPENVNPALIRKYEEALQGYRR